MKNILFIIFLISQSSYSDNHLEISILTCSPGDEVYSVFGHSAIRIKDKDQSLDLVYNFGMFDFKSPNFTFKFIRGKLKYYLGIQKTEDFLEQYTRENRLVLEQKLNLSEKQEIQLLTKLNYLYKPENRQYYYSFLKKNCSTEIRDLLSEIGVNFPKENLEVSYRQLINYHLADHLWLRFGINLVLGKSIDQNANKFESTFLPIYLKEEISDSQLNGRPLVKLEQTLNTVENRNKRSPQYWFSPILIFSLLFLLFLFCFPRPAQIAVIVLIGGAGLVLSLMWLFSDHPEVRNNLNILWCNPLYLLYLPLMIKNKSSILLAFLLMALLFSTIIIWLIDLQIFDTAIIPILLILGILNYKQIRKSAIITFKDCDGH
ncbi:Lnb N-terminal periplasmic domain-containing protein [Autumnicola edwardsiae]|uniref:DUF4105 domain-containing protein n=1 Tax=Autumnicola edwardsiae TaxID=3075594 RepID=A0ABU3CXW4_9FLAO|nr:DUF4105 domain-containing protein [Zunongwangia sp. F297]MDT0651212.1 DUF4105 domain-containing protein [Zunongwangia sp. F297]